MEKILFVYEYLGLGGVEAILATRMRTLKKLGYSVRAMFNQNKGGKFLYNDLQNEVLLPLTPLEKIEHLSLFKPDLIITLDTPSIVEIAHIALPQIPILYEVHTTYDRELRFLKSLRFVQQIRMFLVPSDTQKQFIQKILKDTHQPIWVVPNAFDERYAKPLPIQPVSKTPIVNWVGRLDELKNWRGFLEIAKRVATRCDQAEFRLIGGLYSPIENQDALWMLIQQNHLEGKFHWYPAVLPDQMPDMLDQVQLSGGCVVSTSKNESFGMSILEAMARACPIVVPAGGALAELAIDQECGLTYDLSNYDQAVECIVEIIGNPVLRKSLGEQAFKRAQNFNADETTRIFLDAIKEIER